MINVYSYMYASALCMGDARDIDRTLMVNSWSKSNKQNREILNFEISALFKSHIRRSHSMLVFAAEIVTVLLFVTFGRCSRTIWFIINLIFIYLFRG